MTDPDRGSAPASDDAAPAADDPHGWSARDPEGDGWSAGDPEGDGWSAGDPDGDGWSAGDPEGDGWSAGDPDGDGWSAGDPEGDGWSAEDPDGDDWADGRLGAEWRQGEAPVGHGDVGGPGGGRTGDGAGDSSGAGAGGADDPELAAAVRTVRLVAAAGVLVVLAVVATLLSGALDDDDGDAGADDPTLGGAPAVVVGPPAGTDVAAYLADRREALAAADGTRVAVVSLTSYRPDTAVEDVIGSAAGVEVLARLAAVRGGSPEVVEGSIAEWLVDTRSALQAERDEIAALLPTIEDPDDPFIATYTEDLARLDAQLGGLDPAGDLVFAVVVRGRAEALRALAERPEVRLLDVGADADAGDLTAYRGLRPEETDTAGTPPTRPA